MCLRRCLGFFERGKGSSVGDVAYRITVEASDMADTVHVILNVCILANNFTKVLSFSYNLISLFK